MKRVITSMFKNLKTEFVILFFSIVIFLWKKLLPNTFPIKFPMTNYFTDNRLSGISSFFAITIGVYIAVITILAMSEIGISKELLCRRLDKSLINVIMAGISENLFAVGFSIFVPLNKTTGFVLGVSSLIAIISFIKFIILLVRVFNANMEQMAKVIDEEEKYQADMLSNIMIISQYCRKKDLEKEEKNS